MPSFYNYYILNERSASSIPTWESKENYHLCENVSAVVKVKNSLISKIFKFFR